MNRQIPVNGKSLRPGGGARSAAIAALAVLALPPAAWSQAGGNPAPVIAGPTAAEAAPAQPPATEGIWARGTLTGSWGGARTALEDTGITFGLQEQSELWDNLSGGARQGATYDGLTTASLKIDLEKLAGWQATTFFVDAFQIHGRGPSGNLVGNLQLSSNLEATRGTKLYDLWLDTSVLNGRLSIRFGQEGANDEMMVTQYGLVFLNSSFGFPALPASDLPSGGGPNYPLAAPFVRLHYNAGDGFALAAALFNGDPAPAGPGDPQIRDAGGTAFRLNRHALAFAELWYSPDPDEAALPTTYKLGAWVHTARFADQAYGASGIGTHTPDYAFYGVVDQELWRRGGANGQGIGVFAQVTGAPGDRNLSNLFIEAGLNWKAPFAGRDSDVLGLAVAYEGISPAARAYSRGQAALTGSPVYSSNETVIEALYLYQVAPWWTLQPDVQYILNPGAGIPGTVSNRALPNDLVAGVRAMLTF